MDPRDEVSAERELYDHITQGPRSNPRKAVLLHSSSGEDCSYVLPGEVYRVEKIVSAYNDTRREQCKVHPIGGQPFLVKETAEVVLEMLGWSVE